MRWGAFMGEQTVERIAMTQTETESITVGEVDIGMTIVLPEDHHRENDAGESVRIVDYTSVGEYLEDGVIYAYEDVESGEYLGLLNADLLPDGVLTEVQLAE